MVADARPRLPGESVQFNSIREIDFDTGAVHCCKSDFLHCGSCVSFSNCCLQPYLSICLSGFALSCRGWNGVRILNNQMPSGSRSFIRDHGLHMKNMMLHLHRTRIESGGSSMLPTRTKTVSSSMSPCGTKETGPQRAIGESLPLKLVMTLILCLFLINTAWPRNPRH